MHDFIYHNGNLLALDKVRLSPGQAGLLSGWGLFTTLRLYDGQPFAFERHWQRFRRDAARINLPFDFSAERVLTDLLELVRANHAREACARVYFIYNKFGFWQSDEQQPAVDVLMYTSDLPAHPAAARLALQAHGRHAAGPLTGTKVTSWLPNVWSLEQARRRGFEEVLLLNERGELAECTATNVFIVRNGQVETPPLSSGCLPGVTREVLLELGPEIGVPVVERPLTLQDIRQAQEAFITSTTREVQAVSQVEEHKFPQAPGALTVRLARTFSEYVKNYLATRALRSASS